MSKQSRMTRQKQVVMKIIKNTDTHPTADWIYDQARREIPEISLGTVYRNISVLKEKGEVLELNYGHGSRYDGNCHNHYHFVCQCCGQVYDLNLGLQTQLEEQVAELTGATVAGHRMDFFGTCAHCRQTDADAQKQELLN